MAKPSTLTPEVHDRIVEALRSGCYLETAAAYAGVPRATFYEWLRRGRAGDGDRFVRLADAIEKALADAELRDLLTIARASESQWQASAWRLERRYPEKYGRRQVLQHEGPQGGPIPVEVEGAADRLVARLAAVIAGTGEAASSPGDS